MPSTSGSFMMSTMTRFLEMGSRMMSHISCLYLQYGSTIQEGLIWPGFTCINVARLLCPM